MGKDYTKIFVDDKKQIELLKLLHEGSLPLSKARVKLRNKTPMVVVTSLNHHMAKFIQAMDNEWLRSELMFCVWCEFGGRKKQIQLSENVVIDRFHPNKENAECVILKLYHDEEHFKKSNHSTITIKSASTDPQ